MIYKSGDLLSRQTYAHSTDPLMVHACGLRLDTANSYIKPTSNPPVSAMYMLILNDLIIVNSIPSWFQNFKQLCLINCIDSSWFFSVFFFKSCNNSKQKQISVHYALPRKLSTQRNAIVVRLHTIMTLNNDSYLTHL